MVEETFSEIEASDAFIAFGTRDYCEDTKTDECTYAQLRYWRNAMQTTRPNRLIPIRKLHAGETFLQIKARVFFQGDYVSEEWHLGEPLPDQLVTKIVRMVNTESSISEVW